MAPYLQALIGQRHAGAWVCLHFTRILIIKPLKRKVSESFIKPSTVASLCWTHQICTALTQMRSWLVSVYLGTCNLTLFVSLQCACDLLGHLIPMHTCFTHVISTLSCWTIQVPTTCLIMLRNLGRHADSYWPHSTSCVCGVPCDNKCASSVAASECLVVYLAAGA